MAQATRRDYEVSIWTLQDEFISVLKPTGVVNKGQIENANLKIVDDGTQEFSFSIPMYIYVKDQRVENPIWKNVQNGNVIEDMRKIKVTFNRMTGAEKTFEFLITDVTERHENDQLYCDVNCEGMAFHELGKRGYSIKLLSEDFYLESDNYFTRAKDSKGRLKVTKEPRATLSYWLDKFLPEKPIYNGDIDARTWYYKIDMDWSSYANGMTRKRNEVYEEEFVSSWNKKDGEDVYTPGKVERAKIKERLVDLKESNIYNLTQDLAETFGVFCRYEYEHNENLEIIGRTVVFYNNYMKENEGYIDLTYPYETAAVTRVRDSKDLTTKMYVTQVEDQNSESGVLSIMDVPANRSREEYLLNFEYLYSIGGITAEQYQEIAVYETKLGELNKQIAAIVNPLIALQNKANDLASEIANRDSSITAARTTWTQYNDKLNALGQDQAGTITRGNNNPVRKILVHSDDASKGYYVDFTEEGVKPETVKIWNTVYSSTEPVISTDNDSPCKELSGENVYDSESGSLIKIIHIVAPSEVDLDSLYSIYATFSYAPFEYYEKVKQTMDARVAADTAAKDAAEARLADINDQIARYEAQREQLLADKEVIIKAFEQMMGPAIRESYWQPEDYNDYGDNYIDKLVFSNILTVVNNGESTLTSAIWEQDWKQTGTNEYETLAFPDEQLSFYEGGIINTERIYYPIIDLSGHEGFVKENYDKLTVMFYDFHGYESDSDKRKPKNLRQFVVGSGAQYGFALKNGQIIPVLVVTGAADLIGGKDDENYDIDNNINSLKRLLLDTGNTQVGVVETNVYNGQVNVSVKDGSWFVKTNNSNGWLNVNSSNKRYTTSIKIYYPRIKVGSMAMKTAEDQLGLIYCGDALENYKDYYVLSRDDSVWTNGQIDTSNAAYYVTIKPETFMRYGLYTSAVDFKFCISNANIAIYLDALQVLKENSQPKVSYTVNASFVDTDFIYDLYNKLNRICNINDSELHFENVQGYISEIDLDCDIPANDKIEVKNYKTKFEDLFSSIVAQTQSMKKSEYAIGLAAGAFTSSGDLRESVMESSWRRVDFNYAFNQGKLTINEKDGIWGTSDAGVVAFRGGGIFTASKKDDAGNWIWNTGILPQGINADLITTGRLDTNKINIYAGDNIRLQLNADGLFAYKTDYFAKTPYYVPDYPESLEYQKLVLENMPSSDTKTDIMNAITTDNGCDAKQFVTVNQEGLFLVAKRGALYFDNGFKFTDRPHINRVSISWDGLTLRNWDNDKVFYADMKGNLTLTGTIYAHGLYISDNTHTDAPISTYISQLAEKGIYTGEGAPTSIVPGVVGDLYLDTETGYYWRCDGPAQWSRFNVGSTKFSVDPATGIIDMKAGSNIYIEADSQILLKTGNTEKIKMAPGEGIILSSASSIALTTGTTSEITNKFLLNSNGITLSSTAGITLDSSGSGSIVLNGSGGINLNSANNITMTGGNITMTGGKISLVAGTMTYQSDTQTEYLQEATQLLFKLSGQPVFSITSTDSTFKIQPDTLVNDLQVDGELTAGPITATSIATNELIINGTKFTPNGQGTQFSTIKIIFTGNDGTSNNASNLPAESGVLWVYPTTQESPPVTPSIEDSVTWSSGKISSRVSINSATNFESDAIKFKGSALANGAPYTYTAKIKVYGTGSGTRTITTGSTLTIGGVTLTLSNAVSLSPGSEKTLVFKATQVSNNITNSSPRQGKITIQTSGSGAYVNLQKDVTNTLTIKNTASSSGASIASINDVKDCVVKYIP